MKKIRNLFWMEIKKTIFCKSFLLLVLTVIIMCFFLPVLLDDSTMTNCFSVFLTMPKEKFAMEYSLGVRMIMSQINGAYFVMFTPMIVSISLLPILCEEKENKVFRLILVRSGKKQILIANFLACIFCGGILMMAGYLLFAGILGLHSYILLGSAGMETVRQTSLFVLTKSVGVFAYGMMCAAWTYMISACMRNRYLLASTPYIVLWFLQRFANNIQAESVAGNLWRRLYVQIFGAYYVFVDLKYALQTIAIYVVIGVLIILLHMEVLKRRTDCGA